MVEFVEGFVETALVAGSVTNKKGDERKRGGVPVDDAEFGIARLLQTPVVEANFVDEGFLEVAGGLQISAVAGAFWLEMALPAGGRGPVEGALGGAEGGGVVGRSPGWWSFIGEVLL